MDFGKTLVIQAFPGIGDMLWHLPYLRALAQHTREGKLSLLTKSRTMAKEWLSYDPLIQDIFYAERQGLTRSISTLKKGQFNTLWVLHRSFSYALMGTLAGIKRRYGFGYGAQKYLLTERPVLDASKRHTPTIDQLKALLDAHYIPYDPGNYKPFFPRAVLDQVSQRFSRFSDAIALGIGASDPQKKWPGQSFVDLTLKLNALGYPHVFLCGGPQEAQEAQALKVHIQKHGGTVDALTDLPIAHSLVFMQHCRAYIGNDTALLNGAACFGTPVIGLFVRRPLTYAPQIQALKGPTMQSITVDQVLEVFTKTFPNKKTEGDKAS